MARTKHAAPVAPAGSALDALFSARSVAVVGGAPDSYWTLRLLENLALGRTRPRAFTVHPHGRKVGSLPCVASLSDAPVPPELAVLVTPYAQAPALLAEAAAAGARAAIVVDDPPAGAAGATFPPPGLPPGFVVAGPASLGALSPARGSYPFLGRLLERPPAGGVGLVSQSGGVAIELLRTDLSGRFGWSHVLAVGPGDSFGAAAALEALAADDDTRVIGAYLETLEDPPRLARAVAAALRAGKPVVAVRGPDRALPAPPADQSRAESSLSAGAESAFVAGFLRHCGVAEVPTLEALVEALAFLTHRGVLHGRRVGVAALSSSAGRLAAAAFRAAGLELPAPGGAPGAGGSAPARKRAGPPGSNPLDLTGRVLDRPGDGARLVRAFAANDGFDVVVFVGQPPRGTTSSDRRLAAWVEALSQGAGKDRTAIAAQVMHGPVPAPAADPARRGNPVLAGLGEAAAAVAAACAAGEALRRLAEPIPSPAGIDPAAAGAPLLGPARTLSEPASLELLGRYGIPVAPWRLCTTATAASRFARELGTRVAVKAATPDVPAKAAAGLVRLGLDGDAAVRTAFHDVTIRAQALVRPERLLGATVMGMVEGTARLLAGLVRHPRLGMLVVARRADLAGAQPAVVARGCPLRASEAYDLAAELGLGASSASAVDVDALANVLVRLGRLGADLGAIVAAVCIGPLIVAERGRGCTAVDASVVVRPP
ncbi:MAG: acetate--CoA ligase family protein [Deltaproteobacteria bacterium]|nr:acetate--CoA ligase family protein [Deltaproteobacteria bacterium]